MKHLNNKFLRFLANSADRAFHDSMGLASRGYGYEPKMPDKVKEYRMNHTSKIEKLFDTLIK